MLSLLPCLTILLFALKTSAEDCYTAAVVEYHTPRTTLAADHNLMSNADVYADFMANASRIKVDIIVFPEGGLSGQGNLNKFIELPPPSAGIAPCDESSYHPPLMQVLMSGQVLVRLSCAARESKIYTVINLSEKYINATTNSTELYNSIVVFDRTGVGIGRYRKFNPYGEPVTKPSVPDHHYFQTDFGVRFGMFTCFDLNFLEPAIVMARQHGVSHFVFPHCWISELPFLTAVQAQWGWAYSLNVTLLAAGCNQPEAGGSGSGIYYGRQGALDASQTETQSNKMLIARVPKNNSASMNVPINFAYSEPKKLQRPSNTWIYDIQLMVPVNNERQKNQREDYSRLSMLRDYLDVYNTFSLEPSNSPKQVPFTNSSFKITETIKKTVCQNSFCCDFQLNVTSLFSSTPSQEPRRGDDFSQLRYRLAVFDGVRWYGGGLATGGVQVCSVVPCTNDSISSCGLRADDSSSQQEISTGTFGRLYKTGTVFENIVISSKFLYNNTFIYPDIFVTGSSDSFGSLMTPEQFTYGCSDHSNSVVCTLKTTDPLPHLITAAIYARQFDRDGQSRTELFQSFAGQQTHSLLMIATLSFIIFQIIV